MAESRKRQEALDRDDLRIALAALFLAAEIGAARGDIDDNGELADRALRRADMLLQRHDASSQP